MVSEVVTFDDADSTQPVPSAPVVRSLRVTELFGQYDYSIKVQSSDPPPIILLYGDNGSGKTTILTLLWNLLSPAENRSHRTALAQTPFREFSVELSNGDTILAHKTSGVTGDFEVIVSHGKRRLFRELYPVNAHGAVQRGSTRVVKERVIFEDDEDIPTSVDLEREISDSADVEDQYIKYLNQINVDPYFLADNRRIYSDHFKPEPPESIVEYEYQTMLERHRAVAEARDRSSLASELTDAMRRTSGWLRQQVISGTAQGSQGADAIYLDVLSQIVGTSTTPIMAEPSSLDDVTKRIVELDARSGQFNEFGLVPRVRAERFLNLLDKADPARAPIIEGVLTPYLDGQRARLDSLQPIESLIRTFVETVNSFLVNKRLSYTLGRGLRIRTTGDEGIPLLPRQLSSGERQLLLLLCHAMLSRAESALFIIDEPEISLNAKWQRKLIPALLACVEASNVQFILATHSVEIITGHRQFLAQLRNRRPRESNG